MRVGEKDSNTMVEYYGMAYIVVCSGCKRILLYALVVKMIHC